MSNEKGIGQPGPLFLSFFKIERRKRNDFLFFETEPIWNFSVPILLKYIQGYENPTISSIALRKGVHKAIEDKINGINNSEAILNEIIEADFYLPLSDETLASMIEGYIVLQHRIWLM